MVEFLTPVLSAKTGIIIPMVQRNCGAVPVFLQDIMQVSSSPSAEYWRGVMTCGAGILGLILFPGFLKVIKWLYSFVRSPEQQVPK